MQRLRFRFRDPEDPLVDLTKEFPGTAIVAWCNFRNDVLELRSPDPATMERFVQRVRAGLKGSLRPVVATQEPTRRSFLAQCPSERKGSNAWLIDMHGGLLRQPIVYRDGWEHYEALMLEDDRVPDVCAAIAKRGAFVLDSKRRVHDPLYESFQLLSASELLSSLTGRQAQALLSAVEAGYYDIPRVTSMQELAARRKVPRATLEEHVRKAEAKLIKTLAPHVALALFGERPASLARSRRSPVAPWPAGRNVGVQA